ncbi:MAG: hypothetical protein GY843_18325 [Neptuniibacter sp.]|nr:hypothetical protein [Neptuniibacter sp.]
MNIDQVKPGPPDNKTTYSLPSLRLPEVEEPDEQLPETRQQMIDNQFDDKQQIRKPEPLIDESITERMPTNPHRYNLRSRPHKVAALVVIIASLRTF